MKLKVSAINSLQTNSFLDYPKKGASKHVLTPGPGGIVPRRGREWVLPAAQPKAGGGGHGCKACHQLFRDYRRMNMLAPLIV